MAGLGGRISRRSRRLPEVLDFHGKRRRLFRPAVVLSRSAAELPRFPKDPLLDEIERYWQNERRRVVRLCDAAGFREPRDLADKLLLLVHGSRNERQAYGHHAPSRMLSQAGDDLMVVHGAARKPPLFG
jgi:hypothetical protein